MSEKLCLFCVNFKIRCGTADTYGNGGEDYMECAKGKKYFGLRADDEDDFRNDMLFAESCPDYKQVKP